MSTLVSLLAGALGGGAIGLAVYHLLPLPTSIIVAVPLAILWGVLCAWAGTELDNK